MYLTSDGIIPLKIVFEKHILATRSPHGSAPEAPATSRNPACMWFVPLVCNFDTCFVPSGGAQFHRRYDTRRTTYFHFVALFLGCPTGQQVGFPACGEEVVTAVEATQLTFITSAQVHIHGAEGVLPTELGSHESECFA